MTATAPYEPETFPRRWVPEDATFTTWEAIEPWYRRLLERPIGAAAELEAWLLDAGELNAAVSQEGVERYIAMTCQTDDEARKAAHLEWVREVEPRLKPLQNALRERYLDSPFRAELPADRYGVFDRAQANRRALYREANIPRETALAELEQRYQEVIGAQAVTYRGQEYTLAAAAALLEGTDRGRREEVWSLVAERRLQDRDALDHLFDRMLAIRGEIAGEAGLGSFTDYAYRLRERFDYGPEQAGAFRDAVERHVVPLHAEIQERRRERLGLDRLRPWDLAVDPLGREPLRPFADAGQLAEGTERIFAAIDAGLGAQFRFLRERGLLDLANRKGKAPGGYQETLEDDRLPFIFMNAVGVDGDLRTLLHEGGHAFHSLAARAEPLASYRHAPIEFCEVASMSMELLGARDTGVFYGPDDAERSYRQLLEGIIGFFPWCAVVDGFQHWLYAHPGHTRDERRDAWSALLDRFGGIVDWTGYETVRGSSWQRQLHIYLFPFYYIEYGIAQLGALQIWRRSQSDRPGAIAAYRRALDLGGSRPLPALFAAADLRFDFGPDAVRPLMESVREELDRLAE
jgi:oligoendopeptidase F